MKGCVLMSLRMLIGIGVFIGFLTPNCNLNITLLSTRVIDRDTLEFLKVIHPRLSTFYTLPETHKHMTRPPGLPIVSSNGNLTESVSQLVDRHLRTYLTSLFSYTKDTLNLLKHIEGLSVPQDALLVSLDVEALYRSIPHDRGWR